MAANDVPRPGVTRSQTEPLHAWLTLLGSFVNNIMCVVPQAAFPVLYDHLIHKYDSSRAVVGGAQFVCFFTTSIGCFLASPFIHKFGPRRTCMVGSVLLGVGFILCALAPSLWCFFLFFILVGFGRSPVVLGSMVVIQQQFQRNRGVATAISCSGYYVSDTITPLMTSYFVRSYGLSGAFLLIGGFTLNALPFSMIFSEKTRDTSKTQDDVSFADSMKLLVDRTVFKEPSFVMLFVLRFLVLTNKFTVLGHGVSAARHVGFSQTEAAFTASVFGVSCLVSVALSMVLLRSRRVRVEVFFAVGNGFGVVAALLSLLAVVVEPWLLYPSMVFTGPYVGVGYSTFVLTTNLAIGVDKINRALSLFEFMLLPGSMTALPFGGWLIDVTGDYILTFTMALVFGSAAFVLGIIIAYRVRRTAAEANVSQVIGVEDL